jgi:hypothetical protein
MSSGYGKSRREFGYIPQRHQHTRADGNWRDKESQQDDFEPSGVAVGAPQVRGVYGAAAPQLSRYPARAAKEPVPIELRDAPRGAAGRDPMLEHGYVIKDRISTQRDSGHIQHRGDCAPERSHPVGRPSRFSQWEEDAGPDSFYPAPALSGLPPQQSFSAARSGEYPHRDGNAGRKLPESEAHSNSRYQTSQAGAARGPVPGHSLPERNPPPGSYPTRSGTGAPAVPYPSGPPYMQKSLSSAHSFATMQDPLPATYPVRSMPSASYQSVCTRGGRAPEPPLWSDHGGPRHPDQGPPLEPSRRRLPQDEVRGVVQQQGAAPRHPGPVGSRTAHASSAAQGGPFTAQLASLVPVTAGTGQDRPGTFATCSGSASDAVSGRFPSSGTVPSSAAALHPSGHLPPQAAYRGKENAVRDNSGGEVGVLVAGSAPGRTDAYASRGVASRNFPQHEVPGSVGDVPRTPGYPSHAGSFAREQQHAPPRNASSWQASANMYPTRSGSLAQESESSYLPSRSTSSREVPQQACPTHSGSIRKDSELSHPVSRSGSSREGPPQAYTTRTGSMLKEQDPAYSAPLRSGSSRELPRRTYPTRSNPPAESEQNILHPQQQTTFFPKAPKSLTAQDIADRFDVPPKAKARTIDRSQSLASEGSFSMRHSTRGLQRMPSTALTPDASSEQIPELYPSKSTSHMYGSVAESRRGKPMHWKHNRGGSGGGGRGRTFYGRGGGGRNRKHPLQVLEYTRNCSNGLHLRLLNTRGKYSR